MKRIEKVGDTLIKAFTLPPRIILGIVNAVRTNMPDTLNFPYEVRKVNDQPKEEKHDKPSN